MRHRPEGCWNTPLEHRLSVFISHRALPGLRWERPYRADYAVDCQRHILAKFSLPPKNRMSLFFGGGKVYYRTVN